MDSLFRRQPVVFRLGSVAEEDVLSVMVDLDLERASEIIFVYKLGKPDQEDLRLRIEAQILDQEVTRFARAKTHQCTISYIAEDI